MELTWTAIVESRILTAVARREAVEYRLVVEPGEHPGNWRWRTWCAPHPHILFGGLELSLEEAQRSAEIAMPGWKRRTPSADGSG